MVEKFFLKIPKTIKIGIKTDFTDRIIHKDMCSNVTPVITL